MKTIVFIFILFSVQIITAVDKDNRDNELESEFEPEELPELLLPKPGICGQYNFTEQFNNDQTELGEFPWTVQIAYFHTDIYKDRFDCNGVLINTNYVLAPGDCMKTHTIDYIAEPSFVRLGDWNTSSLIDCSENGNECADPPVDIPIESTVSRYILSEPWVSNIGLLRLKRHVEYTKWISPICLPTADHFANIHSYVGGNFVIVGFNQMIYNMTPQVKYKMNLHVISDSPCEKSFNNGTINKYDTNKHFCIYRNDGFCQRSGTIMAIDNSDFKKPYWYAIGFLSQGLGCTYVMCEKIVSNVQWILENLKP